MRLLGYGFLLVLLVASVVFALDAGADPLAVLIASALGALVAVGGGALLDRRRALAGIERGDRVRPLDRPATTPVVGEVPAARVGPAEPPGVGWRARPLDAGVRPRVSPGFQSSPRAARRAARLGGGHRDE
jgi:hypothetical protein